MRSRDRPRLRDRSTGDLLVLMIASTVCSIVVMGGLTVVLVEIFHPGTDTTAALRTITGIVNTLIGLLAGFLAGRTGSVLAEDDEKRRKEDDPSS